MEHPEIYQKLEELYEKEINRRYTYEIGLQKALNLI